jgi:hypothetical protein
VLPLRGDLPDGGTIEQQLQLIALRSKEAASTPELFAGTRARACPKPFDDATELTWELLRCGSIGEIAQLQPLWGDPLVVPANKWLELLDELAPPPDEFGSHLDEAVGPALQLWQQRWVGALRILCKQQIPLP